MKQSGREYKGTDMKTTVSNLTRNIEKEPFYMLTFNRFPFYVFSSCELIGSRRVLLWRGRKVRIEDTFYARDRKGMIWFFSIRTRQGHYLNQGALTWNISGCPLDRISTHWSYARLEADIHSGFVEIIDVIIHPEFRRRHVASFMLKELVEWLRKKSHHASYLEGILGPADEWDESDRKARDSFWYYHGAEVIPPSSSWSRPKIRINISNMRFDQIRMHRITEREVALEAEVEVLQESLEKAERTIAALSESLEYEKYGQPPWLKMCSAINQCLSRIGEKFVAKIFKR